MKRTEIGSGDEIQKKIADICGEKESMKGKGMKPINYYEKK